MKALDSIKKIYNNVVNLPYDVLYLIIVTVVLFVLVVSGIAWMIYNGRYDSALSTIKIFVTSFIVSSIVCYFMHKCKK